MPLPTYPDDPTEYLAALGPIMIAGTTVGSGSLYIQKGINPVSGAFPALQLNCPHVNQQIMGIQSQYQAVFSIEGTYLDRWETASGRTFEQLLNAANTALYQMARNIRATPDLGFSQSVRADELIDIYVNNATTDLLGKPYLTALIRIQVKGTWYLG